ncbi:hypothetical protein [Endozoicomonas euniceicola]|uniref:Uncharacterized protein n=1 Tax=Endozoicomonas euniceicola TaxID=1234143 RepID=A0ABY6GW88_9GAMM|nr:hypothetical protein [Endozoicomonas euniceicola]UYM17032.1 hypothetical protein NX720_03645 [Endozoicomonas euniceicola]
MSIKRLQGIQHGFKIMLSALKMTSPLNFELTRILAGLATNPG